MDAVVVKFPLFGDSDLIGDFERVSLNSLDRWPLGRRFDGS